MPHPLGHKSTKSKHNNPDKMYVEKLLRETPNRLHSEDLAELPLRKIRDCLGDFRDEEIFDFYLRWLEVQRTSPVHKINLHWHNTITHWVQGLSIRGFSERHILEEVRRWKKRNGPFTSKNDRYPPSSDEISVAFAAAPGQALTKDYLSKSAPSSNQHKENLPPRSSGNLPPRSSDPHHHRDQENLPPRLSARPPEPHHYRGHSNSHSTPVKSERADYDDAMRGGDSLRPLSSNGPLSSGRSLASRIEQPPKFRRERDDDFHSRERTPSIDLNDNFGMGTGPPPPPNYVCHRCHRKGHHLKFCPTNMDPSYDTKPESGYICCLCTARGDHFVGLCPLNMRGDSLIRLREKNGIKTPTRDSLMKHKEHNSSGRMEDRKYRASSRLSREDDQVSPPNGVKTEEDPDRNAYNELRANNHSKNTKGLEALLDSVNSNSRKRKEFPDADSMSRDLSHIDLSGKALLDGGGDTRTPSSTGASSAGAKQQKGATQEQRDKFANSIRPRVVREHPHLTDAQREWLIERAAHQIFGIPNQTSDPLKLDLTTLLDSQWGPFTKEYPPSTAGSPASGPVAGPASPDVEQPRRKRPRLSMPDVGEEEDISMLDSPTVALSVDEERLRSILKNVSKEIVNPQPRRVTAMEMWERDGAEMKLKQEQKADLAMEMDGAYSPQYDYDDMDTQSLKNSEEHGEDWATPPQASTFAATSSDNFLDNMEIESQTRPELSSPCSPEHHRHMNLPERQTPSPPVDAQTRSQLSPSLAPSRIAVVNLGGGKTATSIQAAVNDSHKFLNSMEIDAQSRRERLTTAF